MKISIHPIVLTLLVMIGWTQTSMAATFVITDKTTWETQVLARTHAFSTENFDDTTLNQELTYTTGVGGVYQPELGGGDDDGLWRDLVAQQNAKHPEITTTFEIADGTYAIGGTWDLRPAGQGSHIQMTLLDAAGVEIATHEIPYLQGEFWGVISDEKFSSVRLSSYRGANQRVRETYYLEDMVYSRGMSYLSQGGATPVPLPAAFWLFTSSLLGLLGIGRWRSNSLAPTPTRPNDRSPERR